MRKAGGVIAVLGAAVLTAGCTRPISEKSSLEDWYARVAPDQAADRSRALPQPTPTGPRGGAASTGATAQTVILNPDGTITLNAYLPHHLVAHLRACIVQNRLEFVTEQLLAPSVVKRYEEEGRSLEEITEFFADNSRDILLLLTRLERGVDSPDVAFEQSGSQYRLRVVGWVAEPLVLRTLDMEYHSGEFSLVSIH